MKFQRCTANIFSFPEDPLCTIADYDLFNLKHIVSQQQSKNTPNEVLNAQGLENFVMSRVNMSKICSRLVDMIRLHHMRRARPKVQVFAGDVAVLNGSF